MADAAPANFCTSNDIQRRSRATTEHKETDRKMLAIEIKAFLGGGKSVVDRFEVHFRHGLAVFLQNVTTRIKLS